MIYTSPLVSQGNMNDTRPLFELEEDCNLSDNEEEKTQIQGSTQKKALLSIDKIISSIKV